MFNFRHKSVWNLELELECFIIFKELEENKFPRNMHTSLCDDLAKKRGVDSGTLKAKVGNFKSEAGYTAKTNASEATKCIMKHYFCMNVLDAKALLKGYQLAHKEISHKKSQSQGTCK